MTASFSFPIPAPNPSAMPFHFIKMHGLGNDYVYADGFSQSFPDPARLSVAVSHRNLGIGGDGLILVLPPEAGVAADARMRMFNADGSEGEMCGNGVRCVCKMVVDHKLGSGHANNPLRLQTGRGVLSLAYELGADGKVAQVRVDMSPPILDPVKVPALPEKMRPTGQAQTFVLSVPGSPRVYEATLVSMGNPHAVIYVPEVSEATKAQLLEDGKALEFHPAFPRRINVHFVQVLSKDEVRVLHWERGSGPTLACGTGACACAVAGMLSGRTGPKLLAHLPGGDLRLEWDGNPADSVFMTGPATEAFSGVWPG